MTLALNDALRGGLRAPRQRAAAESALLLGAGGWLGAALLSQLLAAPYLRVGAWIDRTEHWRGSTHRRVEGLGSEALLAGSEAWQGASAFIVLERGGLSGPRDAVFAVPRPEQLLDLATRLRTTGVQRLVVVLPHLPGSLPEALRHGFADGSEQQLAALGFRQLLLVRSSCDAQSAPTSTGWLQRLADLWWAQLKWMLPSNERPLRSVALARVVVAAARLLPELPGSVFILPQEVASRAVHEPAGIVAVLRQHWQR